MERLAATMPDVYVGTTQLRTLQCRVKAWRAKQANDLVLGHLNRTPDHEMAAMAAISWSTKEKMTTGRG